ncbi:MAG: 50S ribosomal protein L15 [Candidatus Delongbacteria bacterium]|nr:50S ribosomal protein L15 [Candidatus Delongbacteria bacterium]MBN2836418.1 50S ribosomal protein L15 [Candidatus Delongbacteria bacterium]
MKINELAPNEGQHKAKTRVGRGPGSKGKTSGRGEKGQKSRSGYSRKMYHEGGQTPMTRRLPKVGFNNIFKIQYNEINIEVLNRLEEDVITPEVLKSKGLININRKVKILGNGEINKAKEVHAHAFTKSAVDKISQANGKVVEL